MGDVLGLGANWWSGRRVKTFVSFDLYVTRMQGYMVPPEKLDWTSDQSSSLYASRS